MSKDQTPLEKLADRRIDPLLAAKAVRFSHLNPEQKLAYVLALMVEQKKETLQLLAACNTLAKECVEWRKTPEGQAWGERHEGMQ